MERRTQVKKSVAASEKPAKVKEFDKELFKRSVEYNVRTLYRKNLEEADAQQIFQAVSYAIKDRIVENWMETQKASQASSRSRQNRMYATQTNGLYQWIIRSTNPRGFHHWSPRRRCACS